MAEDILVFGLVNDDGIVIASAAGVFELLTPNVGLPHFQHLLQECDEPPNEFQELLPDEVFERIGRRVTALQQ